MIQNLLGFDSDILIILLLILVIILLVIERNNQKRYKALRRNYRIFMSGKSAKNLEASIVRRLDEVDQLFDEHEKDRERMKEIEQKLSRDFTHCAVIKYDALKEDAGKLSYSLAMLTDKNTGFVLSAIHSKSGCYTYVKEIVEGSAIQALSEEETLALKQAKES